MLLNGEQRSTGYAVKQVQHTLLGRLRHRIHALSIVLHRYQRRRRWEVAVPYIMVDSLKVPDKFPCVAIEGQQSVCIKVIAGAVGAVEV